MEAGLNIFDSEACSPLEAAPQILPLTFLLVLGSTLTLFLRLKQLPFHTEQLRDLWVVEFKVLGAGSEMADLFHVFR